MGRPNKKKRPWQKNQDGPPRKKRAKQSKERFWILDCQNSKAENDEEKYDIELLVTRSELVDSLCQLSKGTTGTVVVNEEKVECDATNPNDEVVNSKENTTSNAADDATHSKQSPRILSLDLNSVVTPVTETLVEQNAISSSVTASIEQPNLPKVYIKKSRSAGKPFSKVQGMVDNFRPLPNGDCGDGIVNPHPKDEVADKFWSQRRRLFTLFDKGIQLDKESWYSVTPEVIANHIANRLVSDQKDMVVADLFCGCGGNAIAFAARPEIKLVVCIDVDIEKLKMAYHNATIYGVETKLLLVNGNALSFLSKYQDGSLLDTDQESDEPMGLPGTIDAFFLSPPWGGVDYVKIGKHGFDLACIKVEHGEGNDVDGEYLHGCVAKAAGKKTVAYFLPKNTNGTAFAQSSFNAGFAGPIVMEQNVLNGKLKTVTAYFGLGT